MEVISAVCVCEHVSEERQVLAVRRGRFQFTDNWGVITWVLVILLSLSTTGVWVALIILYKWREIFNPKYYCNHCGVVISKKQFRA